MSHTLVVCKPRLPEQYLTQRLELQRQLEKAGISPVVYFPVFELTPDPVAIEKLVQWVKSPVEGNDESRKADRLVVFVSPSVLEIVASHLGPWPADLFCGVMGRQSAQLAMQLGIPAECIVAPTGETGQESEDSDGLARLLSQRFPRGALDLVVCKGPRGRVDFPVKLQEQGHQVQVLECYDRKAIEQTDEQCRLLFGRPAEMAVWVTSSETVEVLDQQLGKCSEEGRALARQQLSMLTTHPRITAKCRELGYAHVVQIPTGIQSVNAWLQSNKKHMENNNPQPSVNATIPAQQGASKMRGTAPSTSKNEWLGRAAFFISIVSFAMVLLVAFAGKNQIEKTRLAFGERIQKESTTLDLVKEEISKSADLTKDLKTRFDLLELAQKEEASQRASLEEVYNSLLASRTEVSLSEVEQLISIARRQLYLLGNVKGASIALSQAVELLDGTEKPSLINLRTALEKDLTEIQALPNDDLLKLAISLDSVVNSIDSLPMLSSLQATTDQTLAELTEEKPEVVEQQKPVATAAGADQQVSGSYSDWGFSQAWKAIKQVANTVWYDIKSLVEVTKVDSPELLMLSSRQETDLRNTLRLSLLNARISLLSRQGVLLKSDLERSSALLETYFDTKSVQVQRAQSVIGEIREVQLDLALPELQATSAALRLALAGKQGDRQ
ncbi:MAG TPA: uroporphyrinogen-III C-methyltransferase [Limnobacter sp.]|nr:uroporphyrinogen-III C-methyltransferase [Limnobacter sp.]